MDWDLWVGTVSALGGIVLTQGFNMVIQKRTRQESRRQQWDRDIIELTGEMISIARKLLPISDRYWKFKYHQYVTADIKEWLKSQIEEVLEKMDTLVGQLELIAGPELTATGKTFHDDCQRRFATEEEDVYVGAPIPDREIDIEMSAQRLIRVTKSDIDIDRTKQRNELGSGH